MLEVPADHAVQVRNRRGSSRPVPLSHQALPTGEYPLETPPQREIRGKYRPGARLVFGHRWRRRTCLQFILGYGPLAAGQVQV